MNNKHILGIQGTDYCLQTESTRMWHEGVIKHNIERTRKVKANVGRTRENTRRDDVYVGHVLRLAKYQSFPHISRQEKKKKSKGTGNTRVLMQNKTKLQNFRHLLWS